MSAPRSAIQPAFRFSCLGPVGLSFATGAEVPFRTRKQAALLFLLAQQPGTPFLRNHLLDLLWSGAEEASARHSLSHTVSLMNKALGCEAIAPSGKDQLALAEGLVWLDVTAFEQHVRDGQAREARALWRGDLFEGLHVPRAPRFERWVETERQRLARTMREVLAELVDAERTGGEWHAMRETAEALHAFDAVDTSDFIRSVKTVTGQNLDWFFDQWLFKPGHPVFDVRSTWDPARKIVTVTVAQVGDLTITFASGNAASFHYTLALGTPPVTVDQTKQVTRQVFRTPGTVCQ
jgi:hypothetical protein